MNETASGTAPSKHDKLMFWGCFIALITTAFAFVSRLFLLGEWGAEFGLDPVQQGELMGIGIWPFAVSIIIFSLFIDKIGYKFAMIFSFVGYLVWSVVGVAAYFVSDGGNGDTDLAYKMLYWGSFLLALSNGTVEAYINPVVATMFSKNKTKWLNILHAGWPGGLVIVGLITIAMANADWYLKIGIIAVPALVFFFMLIPLKFPANERVAAGVTYREMLAEFGFAGAAIVSFLITLQLIRFFPYDADTGAGVHPGVFIGLGVVMVLAFTVYTRSLGNLFVFFMALIMMPLATTELGTDGWIEEIMKGVASEAGFHSGLVLVYTSAIMCALRFCAGPIVHKLSPVGLLIASAALAAVGLFWLGNAPTALIIFAAATLYAFGKTFFWPTMLGIVSEQSPKGGALTLNALGGIGMLAIGTLGSVYIGALQADNQIDGITNDTEIVEAVPGLVDAEGNLTATYTETTYSIIKYSAIDDAKVGELVAAIPEEKQSEVGEKIAKVKENSKQGALADMALFPVIMLVCYVLMFFYFKSKGGYAAQHLTTDEGLSDDAEALAAQGAQE